jgi:hypothetical protein
MPTAVSIFAYRGKHPEINMEDNFERERWSGVYV